MHRWVKVFDAASLELTIAKDDPHRIVTGFCNLLDERMPLSRYCKLAFRKQISWQSLSPSQTFYKHYRVCIVSKVSPLQGDTVATQRVESVTAYQSKSAVKVAVIVSPSFVPAMETSSRGSHFPDA